MNFQKRLYTDKLPGSPFYVPQPPSIPNFPSIPAVVPTNNMSYLTETLARQNLNNTIQPKISGIPDWKGMTTQFKMLPGMNITLPKVPYMYWGNAYPKTEKDNKPNTLADYNDPKQINSIRDIILGSFNPYMNHSKLLGEEVAKTPLLNIIPNSMQYINDYILEPIKQKEWGHLAINQLYNIAETTDVFARLIKTPILSEIERASNNSNKSPEETYLNLKNKSTTTLEDLKKSVIGNEEGIKNYDYNTGNTLVDIGLEVVSDPLNWLSFGGKALVTSGFKTATKEITQEASEKLALNISKEIGETVSEKAIKESVEKATKKAITNSHIVGTKSTLLKSIIRDNTDDIALEAVNKKFTKVFTKNLSKEVGSEVTQTIMNQSTKIIRNTLDDVSKAVLKDVSGNIVNTIGKGMIKTEDIISSGLLKMSLTPSGIYPLYVVLKKTPIRDFLTNQTLRRVKQVNTNRFLTNSETFLNSGYYNGVSQVINKDLKLNALFEQLAEAQGPQQAAFYISHKLKDYIEASKNILADETIPTGIKQYRIINILQSIDSYTKINDLDDFIKFVENLDTTYKQLDGVPLNSSGFEQYLREFNEIKKSLNTLIDVDKATKSLKNIDIESVKAIQALDSLKVFDTYSVKEILSALDNQQIVEVAKNFPINRFDYLVNQYSKALSGSLTEAETTKLIQDLHKLVSIPYNYLATSTGDKKTIAYLMKNMDQVLNNITTPKRGQLRGAIFNNLQNISNRLKAIRTNQDTLFTLDKVQPNLYNEIFFKQTEVLGTVTPELNLGLIKQLKKYEDFIPSETTLFKDSKLYKWMERTNNRYNKLSDFVEKNKKYTKAINQNVNTAQYRDAIQRINDLHEIKNIKIGESNKQLPFYDFIKHTTKATYDKGNITQYTDKILKNESILSNARINTVYRALKNIESFGESYNIVNDYNKSIFENLNQDLRYFRKLVDQIKDETDDYMFNVLSRSIKDMRNTLIKDFNSLDVIIDSKNVLDIKNLGLDSEDLSGLGKSNLRFSTSSQKVFTKEESLNLRKEALETAFKNKELSKEAYDKASLKLQQEYELNKNKLKDIVYKEAIQYPESIQFPDELVEARGIIKQVENLIDEIDFDYIERMEIKTQFDTDLMFAQLDKMYVQSTLNQLVDKIRINPKASTLIEHIGDMSHPGVKQFYENLSEPSKQAYNMLALKIKGIDNYNMLKRELDAWWEAMPTLERPKYVNAKTAILTTLANYSSKRLNDINIEDFMKDFIYRTQGYINGANPLLKSYKVDALLAQNNITESMILNELKDIKNIDLQEVSRHTALYDTVAQIKLYEATSGKDFEGLMLDIETTDLLNSSGYSKGNITEISLVKRNPDTKQIEVVYNGKVQLPEEVIRSEYMQNLDVIKMQGLTEEEYIKRYTKITEEITEKQLLENLYEALSKQDIGEDLMTFNGEDFDLVFLDNKMKSLKVGGELTQYDKTRKVWNAIFKGENLRTRPTFSELIGQFNKRDYYKELAKDRYAFSDKTILDIKNMLSNYFDKQNVLDNYATYIGRNVKVIEGIDREFADFIKGLIKNDDLGNAKLGTEWMNQNEDILNALADLPMDDNLEAHLEITDIIKNRKLNSRILNDALDTELKDILFDFYTDYGDTLRDVGILNTAWRDIPIPSYLFDASHTKYNQDVLMELQNVLADRLPQGSEIGKILREKPMQNLTQLMTAGLDAEPIVAYKKVTGASWELLDISDVIIDTNNVMDANNFVRTIEKTNNTIWNVQDLIPQTNNIYNMLKDLKASNIIFEATISKVDSKNVQFTYATLESLWRKIKYRVENGIDTRYTAIQLTKNMENKYPDLIKLLDNATVHYKPLMNGSTLAFQIPEYIKTQGLVEDIAKHKSIMNAQDNVLKKLKLQVDNSDYKLNAMKDINTTGNEMYRLNKMYLDAQNDGKLIRNYKSIGKSFNEILPAWTTNQFMQLSPEQIRDYVINTGKGHSVTLKKPSNKFFNNASVFDEFSLKKKDLKDLGITWNWDEATQRLTLGIDDDLASKIEFNKNEITRISHYEDGKLIFGSRYLLNGEPIQPVLLAEIPYDTVKQYVKGNEDYINQMWLVRQKLVQMNPELSGQWGLTNYIDDYITAYNNPIIPKFGKNQLEQTEDYLAYFNTWNLGELESISEIAGGVNSDYLDNLNLLSNKMLNHSHKHIEYGQFIMQGGLRLDSDVIQKMSTKELRQMLNANPDCVVVYLADNKYTIGGYELRKLNSFSDSNLEEATKLGATIIPWDSYEIASKVINQFSYQNQGVAIWNKILQTYKKFWIASPGVFIRNAIDSTMKNFAEGDSTTGTIESYAKSFDLLSKFDKTSRAIKKMDPWGRFRLSNAEEYFKMRNPLLDKDTYHFLYDFMQNNGTSSISTEIDGIFSVLMKPNSWIERTARLTQYLNLSDQGYAYSEIMRRISQTHFNYDLKTYSGFIAQNYIPFYTYVSNNINYIIHLVEENPSFLRNFFNVYTPIWDFDSLNYEELNENMSLQYQILNGNIPLEDLLGWLGYKDKEITRTINTKFGPKEQKVTNTAVLRMGSSIIDGLQFFFNPIYNIKEKLAPPVQMLADSVTEYGYSAFGNNVVDSYDTYQENEDKYQRNFGSTSIQSLFRNPNNLLELIPGIGTFTQRYMHKEYDTQGNATLKFGSSVTERTDNKFLGSMPSIFGATSRWGEFTEELKFPTYTSRKSYKNYSNNYKTYPKTTNTYTKKVYVNNFKAATPRPGQGVTYRSYPGGRYSTYYTGYSPRTYVSGKRPWSKYENFLFNVQHPNYAHNKPGGLHNSNMLNIPQYLYSYMGKNKYGKSKLASWMNMSTRYKVKSTLRRIATP